MDKIANLISRLKGLESSIQTTIAQVIKANEGVIIDMNTQEQLYEQGVNSDNVEISSYQPYTPFTVSIKQGKGQPTGRVTLRDEGDFYSGWYIEFMPDGFKLGSSDSKADKLGKKYGYQIFGLTDANLDELTIQYILPELLTLINKIKHA